MKRPLITANPANIVTGINLCMVDRAIMNGAISNQIRLQVTTENISVGRFSSVTNSPVHVIKIDIDRAFAIFNPVQNIISSPACLDSFTVEYKIYMDVRNVHFPFYFKFLTCAWYRPDEKCQEARNRYTISHPKPSPTCI